MGTVVISIDAELGWGFHDLDDPPESRIRSARRSWRTVLALLDEYRLPATWAIVGHLMLENCDGRHLNYPAPPGWFKCERNSDLFSEAVLFGDGLVEAVRTAAVDHEVGSHSFSHIVFDRQSTTERIVRAETTESRRIGRDRGFDLTSFVFPRRKIGFRRVLAEAGFTCYRGHRPPNRTTGGLPPVQKVLRWTVRPQAPPLVRPRIDEFGLVEVPASLFLFSLTGRPHAAFSFVDSDPIVRQAKRGIDEAAEQDGIFHMWFHPNDVQAARDVLRLRTIFDYLDERRRTSDLSVETMGAVASAHLGRDPTRESVSLDPVQEETV